MKNNLFFEETKEQSVIKTKLVYKYFDAWSKVIISSAKKRSQSIAYIDLFCGPGRYNDGTKSTPIFVLEKAITDKYLQEKLITVFNDIDKSKVNSLKNEVEKTENINLLCNQPIFLTTDIGDEIFNLFQRFKNIPTLFFIDPWGYKGLTIGLIETVIKNWGCDCIFFFNYNRINMGLGNPLVREHMVALFGEKEMLKLESEIDLLNSNQRELKILEALINALSVSADQSNRYVLPFCFKNNNGSRTSHYLIFISKNFLGYKIMKDIMAVESTETFNDLPSFTYCSTNRNQLSLFTQFDSSDLEAMLLSCFSGKKMNIQKVIEQHSYQTVYLERHYRQALLSLEEKGRIITNPPKEKRRKDSFSEKVIITFPVKGQK